MFQSRAIFCSSSSHRTLRARAAVAVAHDLFHTLDHEKAEHEIQLSHGALDFGCQTVGAAVDRAVEAAAGATNAVGRFSPRSRARMGNPLDVAVDTTNTHFFDMQSREAIWD